MTKAKTIQLSRGKEAIVDAEDFEWLNQWKWCFADGYASRVEGTKKTGQKKVYLHRVVMNAQRGQIVDHINRNRLDNTRSNLRFVTDIQNARNKTIKAGNNRGVRFRTDRGKWLAQIKINYKTIHLGYFKELEDAIQARKKAEKKYFGEVVV